jgi:hypothetical protein
LIKSIPSVTDIFLGLVNLLTFAVKIKDEELTTKRKDA